MCNEEMVAGIYSRQSYLVHLVCFVALLTQNMFLSTFLSKFLILSLLLNT